MYCLFAPLCDLAMFAAGRQGGADGRCCARCGFFGASLQAGLNVRLQVRNPLGPALACAGRRQPRLRLPRLLSCCCCIMKRVLGSGAATARASAVWAAPHTCACSAGVPQQPSPCAVASQNPLPVVNCSISLRCRQGYDKASPVILEPIMNVEVRNNCTVPLGVGSAAAQQQRKDD